MKTPNMLSMQFNRANNTQGRHWLRWAIYLTISFTASSVLLSAIMPNRFTSLGDPYYHTLVYAPERALLPWLGVVITTLVIVVHHYAARYDKK